MESTQQNFTAAVHEGKALALKHNRPVRLGYSWRAAEWFVDTTVTRADVIVHPEYLEPVTCVGRRALTA